MTDDHGDHDDRQAELPDIDLDGEDQPDPGDPDAEDGSDEEPA